MIELCIKRTRSSLDSLRRMLQQARPLTNSAVFAGLRIAIVKRAGLYAKFDDFSPLNEWQLLGALERVPNGRLVGDSRLSCVGDVAWQVPTQLKT